MNDPVQQGALESAGDQQKPEHATPSKLCFYCGAKREPGARYCAACKRYQPDALDVGGQATAVSICRCCRELIPLGAVKCNHCSAFQKGLGRWFPTSAASISALGTLASLVVLLLNTMSNRPPAPLSKTDLEVIDAEEATLYVRLTNDGAKPSFVGKGWFKLATACDWRQKPPPDLCVKPGAGPPLGVLEVKARVKEDALVNPGHVIVPFGRNGVFELEEIPAALPCSSFDEAIKKFKMCLAFEVIEYQNSRRHCLTQEISNISSRHFLSFVKDATPCE